jgi:phospholipase/carboxylesterase
VSDLDFIHRFVPGADRQSASDRLSGADRQSGSDRTLLLLHGTGGNEDDLLEFGRAIDSEAALLSPRGKVLENGAARFFRRLAEGVFDEADVIRRAHELANFTSAASDKYGINTEQLVAVGYSNGANIAAAMLLLGIAPFQKAILLRAMVPLSKIEAPPDLHSIRILISAGRFDPIAPPAIAQALTDLLRKNGAEVTLEIRPSGHELSPEDVTSARGWLAA